MGLKRVRTQTIVGSRVWIAWAVGVAIFLAAGCGHLATSADKARLYPRVKKICICLATEIPTELLRPDDYKRMFNQVAQPLRQAGYACVASTEKLDARGWPLCPRGLRPSCPVDVAMTVRVSYKPKFQAHVDGNNRMVADSCSVLINAGVMMYLGPKHALVWQKKWQGLRVAMDGLTQAQQAALAEQKRAVAFKESRRPADYILGQGVLWHVLDAFTQPWVSNHFVLDANAMQAAATRRAVESILPARLDELGLAVARELKGK